LLGWLVVALEDRVAIGTEIVRVMQIVRDKVRALEQQEQLLGTHALDRARGAHPCRILGAHRTRVSSRSHCTEALSSHIPAGMSTRAWGTLGHRVA